MLVNFVRVSALPVVVGLEPTGGDTLSPPISLYVSLSLSPSVVLCSSPSPGRRRWAAAVAVAVADRPPSPSPLSLSLSAGGSRGEEQRGSRGEGTPDRIVH